MADDDILAALRLHWAAADANDFGAEHEIYADNAELDYPQSGERIQGRENIQASRMAQPDTKRFTVRRLQGSKGFWVSELLVMYANRPFYVVSLMALAGNKVVRETQYFAEPFEPGASRAVWVERTG